MPFAQVGTPDPLTAMCERGVGVALGFGVAILLPLFDLLEL
jgi:hypothetical protein